MAGALPDLIARVRLDTSDLDKGVKRAAGVGSAIGSAFGNLASGGLSSAFSAVKNFAGGSVDAFAAVEDATGAAGVQFGKSLPQVLAFADKASGSFGLSKRAALDAQNTFGTLGKAAGLAGPDLAGFSGKLTGLAGDLASFKGTSTEQAVEAVGAALRGESEPIRAYGVLLDDASVQAEGLALGLVKPVVNADKLAAANGRVKLATEAFSAAVKAHGANSTEAQRAQLALSSATNAQKAAVAGSLPPLSATNKTLAIQSLILKQTKDAQGDYSRTSTSTANVQKTLQAETENASAALGAKLAPAVTALRGGFLQLIRGLSGAVDAIGGIVGAVQPAVQAFSSNLAPAIGAVVPALQALVAAIPEPILRALAVVIGVVAAAIVVQTVATAAASAATAAWGAITGLFAVVKNAETGALERGVIARAAHNVATIAGTVATVAWTVATTVFSVAMTAAGIALKAALGPVGLIIIGVSLLTAGLIYAYKHSETFRDIVQGAFAAVKAAGQALATFFTQTIPAAFQTVKDKVASIVSGLKDFLAAHWQLILAVVVGPIGLLVLAVVRNFDTIKAVITGAMQAVLSGVTGALGAVQDVFAKVFNAVRAVVGAVLDAIVGVVTTGLNNLRANVQAALAVVQSVFTTVFNAVRTVVQTVLAAVTATVSTAVAAIRGAITSGLSVVDDLFSGAFNAALGVVRSVTGAITGAVSSALGAIRGAISNGLASVDDLFGGAFRAAAGAVRGAIGGILDVVRGVPGQVANALGNLGGLLVGAGRSLMEGLARGIGDKIGEAIQKVRDGLQKIKDLLPGSPIKDGPLLSWNNGGAGKRLMGLLGDGIAAGAPGVHRQLSDALAALPDIGAGVGASSVGALRGGAGRPGVAQPGATYAYDLTVNGADLSRDPGGTIVTALRRMELLTP